MGDAARELLTRGIASAKAGEHQQAVKYLEWSLQRDPDARQRVDAYYWLSKVSRSESERIEQLEKVLQLEPTHFLARRDLALIRGLLAEGELVDPTSAETAASETSAEAARYVCPQCGGRLSHNTRRQQLECLHCGYSQLFTSESPDAGAIPEKDFIEALATPRGHTLPQATAVISCAGCGAEFLLPERLISDSCPYCHSPYILDHSMVKDLVNPSGLVPFQLDQGEAAMSLRRYLDERGVSRSDVEAAPEGIYAPAWTFDVTGEMPYNYLQREGDDWLPRHGSQIVVVNDLPIFATSNVPPELASCASGFNLETMIEFHPSQLAGWPAQTYDLTASDAALKARFQILDQARSRARSKLFGRVKDYRPLSPKLLVSEYRLVLLPLWLTSFEAEGDSYAVAINGESGAVTSQLPARGWRGWLDWLLGRTEQD